MGCGVTLTVVSLARHGPSAAPMITCGFQSVRQSHKEASETARAWHAAGRSITNSDPGPSLSKKEMSLNHIPPSLLWQRSANQDFYMHSFCIGFWKRGG